MGLAKRKMMETQDDCFTGSDDAVAENLLVLQNDNDQISLTHIECINNVKIQNCFTKPDKQILQVNLLNKFELPWVIVEVFGGKLEYLDALVELEREIYRNVA